MPVKNCGCCGGKECAGVAMVEFAVVGMVLFVLTGALVDFGIMLHRWSQVSEVVSATTREEAIATDRCPDAALIRQQLTDNILSVPGIKPDSLMALKVNLSPSSPGLDLLVMNLRAEIQYPCFFCLVLPGGGVTLASTGQAVVETGKPNCPEGSAP